MIKNAMSLKAKINNIAKKEKVLPQAVMQTYRKVEKNKFLIMFMQK